MSYTRDQPLLRIENVSKFYGTKKVLSDITLTLRDLHCSERGRVVGQVIGLLGPSGIGKSTLLRMVAGLEQPTSGAVYLDEEKEPVKAGQVGVVFQNYVMFRHRTVLGNLIRAGRMAGMGKKEAKARAEYYLDMLKLSEDAQKYPAQLSGGMQQRIAIARQLASMDGPRAVKTRLLLMDEPFSALDLENIHKVCKLIRKVADMADGNSVLVVTHDLRAALSVCDGLWFLERGPDGSGHVRKEMDLSEVEFAWNEAASTTPNFLIMENELSEMCAPRVIR